MSFRKIMRREMEVAFSKHSQPIWLRVTKYILLIGIICFFWGTKTLLIIFLIILPSGISLHFWYRYKTKGWTKSYGSWSYEKTPVKDDYKTD
jgi:hypothetical protein